MNFVDSSKVSYIIFLEFKGKKASEDEIAFVKKYDNYHSQFDLKALKSILNPYELGISIGRFPEAEANAILNENQDLNLKLIERNPTLRDNIILSTEREARAKAEEYLNNRSLSLGDDSYLITEIETKRYGWIIHFANKKYLDTNDDSYLLFGSGPLILNKYDGSIYPLGSGSPNGEIYLYELQYFPDFVGSGEFVENELARILRENADVVDFPFTDLDGK
ncbi:YrhB domain-containing protein [Leptospira sarikeiensis]|uniref:Immunity protein 35 domain-containing protein n=1 Tax=Leptospira sarikeiensis TaxID=2484943 RepID=A0A4V3JQX8_9LEPT|nr:YrhB domain-containing protein [Leptospira sarikeiensis]TGL57656.1 hypothetical protein EHQ64_19885 [Leptospira sarikeiensis]